MVAIRLLEIINTSIHSLILSISASRSLIICRVMLCIEYSEVELPYTYCPKHWHDEQPLYTPGLDHSSPTS